MDGGIVVRGREICLNKSPEEKGMKAMAEKPIEDQSSMAALAQTMAAFSEAELGNAVKSQGTDPKGRRYKRLAEKAHPSAVRAFVLSAVCHAEALKLARAHNAMHEEMDRTGSKERTPEHLQVHFDGQLAMANLQMASHCFKFEAVKHHPELREIDGEPMIARDGSIGEMTKSPVDELIEMLMSGGAGVMLMGGKNS